MIVSRASFQAAIEAGLKKANFSPEAEEALREVGRNATAIGGNFNTGCPIDKIGGFDHDNGDFVGLVKDTDVYPFIDAYDAAMRVALGRGAVCMNRIVVEG